MPLRPINAGLAGPGAGFGGVGRQMVGLGTLAPGGNATPYPGYPQPTNGQMPSAANMGPAVTGVPVGPTRSPAGAVPPNSRGPGIPGTGPAPAAPPAPTAGVGLQALAGAGVAPPPPPAATPAPPPALAPLMPDASGITPPPGTPVPPPAATPPATGGGMQTLSTAPPPASTDTVLAEGKKKTTPPPATITAPPPTTDTGTGPSKRNDLNQENLNIGGIDPINPVGSAANAIYDNNTGGSGGPSGNKNFFKDAPGTFNTDHKGQSGTDWSSYFDKDGNLISLPQTPQDIANFITDSGLSNNSEMAGNITSLMSKGGLFDKYQQAIIGGDGKSQAILQKKINDVLTGMKQHGLDLDPAALLAKYGAVPTPTPEENTGITPVKQDPTTGNFTLAGLDPNAPIPDWLRNMDPQTGAAWLTYLGGQQQQANQQGAVNAYQGLGDLYKNDPTRQAAYSYLSGGPHLTYDDATLEKMKANSRTQAGYGLQSLDQNLRHAAAMAGVPTATLSALAAGGRNDILNNLLAGERNVDIQAAQQNAQDQQQYFSNLMGAQGTLVGPMAGYYGGLASLISGTPGLAQTGNPLAGVAQFDFQKQQMNPGALQSRDWAAIAAGGLGSLLGGVGAGLVK